MAPEILVAVLSFVGTLIGSGTAILVNSKLTAYRIQKLEERVGEHDKVFQMTYDIKNLINDINAKVDELKKP